MKYFIENTDPSRGETYKLAKEFGQTLLDNCSEMLGKAPLYRDVTFPTAPQTIVNDKGDIVVSEVPRKGVSRLEKYVAEMAAGSSATISVNVGSERPFLEDNSVDIFL
jgi:hypothetical protein